MTIVMLKTVVIVMPVIKTVMNYTCSYCYEWDD